ncbi:MAG: class I SAM-dependent methyltransferase family protein [Pseudobdellovibrio sp.]
MSTTRKLIEYFDINIRNERFTLDDNKTISIKVDGNVVDVINLSESGIAIESRSKMNAKEIQLIQIFHNQNKLLEFNSELIWEKSKDGKLQYGYRFSDEMLSENFVQNLKLSTDILQELQIEKDKVESLLPDFVLNCTMIKDLMLNLKEKCESFQKVNYILSYDSKKTSIDLGLEIFGKFAIEAITKYAHNLDKILNKITDKEVRKKHADFFKTHLGEYFVSAAFTGRAYHKPRGYAGDYEMMNQIYRNVAEGTTLFEKIIHLYGINEASSVSVRLRKDYLKKKLFNLAKNNTQNSEIVVGTLACGPAREIVEFLTEETPENLKNFKFVLMDQDHHALLNARRNIFKIMRARKLECEINLLPLAVKQILEQSEESEVLKAINFNLLYTAGLYDYLPQTVAKNLTTIISKSIIKGGEFIIGNFHPDNPTKTISDLVADWRLIHRNQEQMLDLISASEFKRHNFYLDEIGIDLFIEAYK